MILDASSRVGDTMRALIFASSFLLGAMLAHWAEIALFGLAYCVVVRLGGGELQGSVVGNIGEGWRQVVSELAFERSGPERFLSTFVVLREALLERWYLNGVQQDSLSSSYSWTAGTFAIVCGSGLLGPTAFVRVGSVPDGLSNTMLIGELAGRLQTEAVMLMDRADSRAVFEGVVGVVNDVRQTALSDDAMPSVYMPLAQAPRLGEDTDAVLRELHALTGRRELVFHRGRLRADHAVAAAPPVWIRNRTRRP